MKTVEENTKEAEEKWDCSISMIDIENTRLGICIPNITKFKESKGVLDYLMELSLMMAINILPEINRKYLWLVTQKDFDLIKEAIEENTGFLIKTEESRDFTKSNRLVCIGPHNMIHTFKVINR